MNTDLNNLVDNLVNEVEADNTHHIRMRHGYRMPTHTEKAAIMNICCVKAYKRLQSILDCPDNMSLKRFDCAMDHFAKYHD